MPIRFACPACSNVMEAPDDRSGQRCTCPQCQHAMLVPSPAGSFHDRLLSLCPRVCYVAAVASAVLNVDGCAATHKVGMDRLSWIFAANVGIAAAVAFLGFAVSLGRAK